MKKYMMQDRSGGIVNRIDEGLSLQAVYHMTDYTDQEFNDISSLEVSQDMLIGYSKDIYIKRTE